MNIILYTTHCPKCIVLQKKMDAKLIDYKEITDIGIMEEKGIMSVPVLEVDGALMDFRKANEWVNEYN